MIVEGPVGVTVAGLQAALRARGLRAYPVTFETRNGLRLTERCWAKNKREATADAKADAKVLGWRVVCVGAK